MTTEPTTISIIAVADSKGVVEAAIWIGQSSVDYYYKMAISDPENEKFLLQFDVNESQMDILTELAKDRSAAGASNYLKACVQFAQTHSGVAVPETQKESWKQFKKQILEPVT